MEDDEIREMFAGLGPVTIRKMFGGKGIYHDGLIIAVVLSGEVHLKGDAESAPDLEAAGARRWTYEGKGGHKAAMPYWSVPESALDDPDEMAAWARKAFQAALRAESRPDRRRTNQSFAPTSMKAGTSSPKPTVESNSSASRPRRRS